MATTPTTIADAMNEKPVAGTPPTSVDVQSGINSAVSGANAVTAMPQISAPKSTTAQTTGYTAGQAEATDWNVTGNQTVQQQLSGLINDNSPLLQSARTRALETAHARGLLNSSMAAGAGEQAVINTALPIAQQDAATYADSAKFNAGQRTSVSQFNTSAQNDASKFGADAFNQSSLQAARNQDSLNQTALSANADMLKSVTLAKVDATTKMALQQLDSASKLQLQQLAENNKLALQSSSMAQQSMNTVIQQIAAIQANPDMTAQAKSDAVARQYALLQNALSLADGVQNLQLSSVLDFTDNTQYMKDRAAAEQQAATNQAQAPTEGAGSSAAASYNSYRGNVVTNPDSNYDRNSVYGY